jgi:anti-anti-sigma regulatory factor/anti-sigma regulatory factor (Ser/Thr protein kinase)
VVPAWGIVAAELGAQVDQQPGPSTKQPVTAEPPIGPDCPDDLLVDHALDREPGQRPNLLTLAALPPDPLAGQDQLGTMADRPGGGHRFLVAPLQEHLPAGQGSRDGEGRGPVGALGRLLDVLGHRHHQVIVALHPPTARIGDYPGGRKPGRAAGTHRGWAMEIQHSTKDGCLIVAFTGSIDLSSVSQIQRALLKDLSEEPFALICDLAGVDTLDPVCATVFATVANHPSSRWPATSFLLCGAKPAVAEILGLLTVPHFLQLYPGVEEAVDAAVARPPYLRDELVLAPTPTAAAAARAFVRDTCEYWRLAFSDTTLVDRAVLVASELVTNAVVHARTELRLRVERRGELLHLAVRDGSPRLLRLATIPDPEAEGGRGLWLVEQLARAWGVNRHPDGGKVVWCTLKL